MAKESKLTSEMTSDEYVRYMAEQAQKSTSNKYGNKWHKVDGINFQSIAESERYVSLKFMKEQGIIRNFKRNVLFKFIINGVLVTTWRADFVVLHNDGRTVVEDIKGVITSEYLIKKALMKACYGITVVEPNLKEPATKKTAKKRLRFPKKNK